MDWKKLLSEERRKGGIEERKRVFMPVVPADFRNEHEKDFDRVVFSTPIRRLQDKTQVFPLDQHDSVRTRLTHSLEVGNLARTIGTELVHLLDLNAQVPDASRKVPSLLAAIGIAHDIGNPPFGHQGESAIRDWVSTKEKELAGCTSSSHDKKLLADYQRFDGNPQGFRLLTRLQTVDYSVGLNLTASSLRAFVKYSWASSAEQAKAKNKFGYFQSEANVFHWACEATGVPEGNRHPLTSIMEACDDIAYSVLDIEDGIKKELISTADVVCHLSRAEASGTTKRWISAIIRQYKHDRRWVDKLKLKAREQEDCLTQLMRAYFVSALVREVAPVLKQACEANATDGGQALLRESAGAALLKILKSFAKEAIYDHKSVVEIELRGHMVIPALLEAFWQALSRADAGTASKKDLYVLKRISPNYMRVYRGMQEKEKLPSWYVKFQVVCDMVCGMTDSYAVDLCNDFRKFGVIGDCAS